MKHLIIALALLLPATASAAEPNIIFIMADDLGYGDAQPLNPASKIPTPAMNRLAAEGMTFTDAHTPSAVCTPTRYGVVTGRYCWRSRLTRGVLNGYSPPLIESDRPTIASLLRSRGYTTGVVGKWHLGLGFAKTPEGKLDFTRPVTGGPNALGFDFSYLIPASLDFPPYVYVRNGKVTQIPEIVQPSQSFPAFLRKGERSADLVMENCLDHLLTQAVGFIRREAKAEKPFFLYFPLTAPHKPVLPHPRFRGASKLGPYGDFVVQVDWTVGKVLETLDRAGIAQDTLIMFSSDNGSFMYRLDEPDAIDHVADETVQGYRPNHHTANQTLRGTKADVWEGGHRVPFFARWPTAIKPGSRCDTPICLTDLFATVADVVDAEVPRGAAEDSFSMLPLLKGEKPETSRAPVIHHSAAGMFAIRDGRWKLVLGNGSGGRQNPRGRPFERPYHLFDLAEDRAEQANLIEQHPEVAKRLEAACEAIRAGKK